MNLQRNKTHNISSANQGRRSIFRIGGGGGGVGGKSKKNVKFFGRSSVRKVAVLNFAHKARRKIENCVCLVLFLR